MKTKVKCNNCGQVIIIPVNQETRGKMIQFACKNKTCDNLITFKVPRQAGREIDRTVITGDVTKPNISFLEIQENEFGQAAKLILNKGKMVVGRKSSTKQVDLQINSTDAAMSRQHCTIDGVIDNQKRVHHILSDNDSKAGTFLNGDKLHAIDEMYLEENDEIRLGRTVITYKRS